MSHKRSLAQQSLAASVQSASPPGLQEKRAVSYVSVWAVGAQCVERALVTAGLSEHLLLTKSPFHRTLFGM